MATWSGIRVKLEKDYLAPSLRGHITYFATSYSKCPDHEGRAAVLYDGKEILSSNYYEHMIYQSIQWNKIKEADPDISDSRKWIRAFDMALKKVHLTSTISIRLFKSLIIKGSKKVYQMKILWLECLLYWIVVWESARSSNL